MGNKNVYVYEKGKGEIDILIKTHAPSRISRWDAVHIYIPPSPSPDNQCMTLIPGIQDLEMVSWTTWSLIGSMKSAFTCS